MKITQMIVKSICNSFFSYSVMKENTNEISKKILITQEYDRDLGVYVCIHEIDLRLVQPLNSSPSSPSTPLVELYKSVF